MKESIEIMDDNIIERIKNEYKYLDFSYFAILFSCIIVIFAYGKYRCSHIKDHKDILEFDLIKNSGNYGIDGWSLSHFLFFMLIGYLYHNVFFITFLLGIIWELFETYVGIYEPDIIKGWGFCKIKGNRYKKWWYGKMSDPIVNFFGLILGIYLYRWIN